jgi:hypothetical protein
LLDLPIVKKLLLILSLGLSFNSFVVAQELPRPSLARHEDDTPLPTTYNMKLGPVLFDFTGSVDSEFNDNIGLNNTGTKSDFLITPEVGVGIRWPVTQTNTLALTTSLGYTSILNSIRPISWSRLTRNCRSTSLWATSSSTSTTPSLMSRTP